MNYLSGFGQFDKRQSHLPSWFDGRGGTTSSAVIPGPLVCNNVELPLRFIPEVNGFEVSKSHTKMVTWCISSIPGTRVR
jgi:hypothetical protein